MNTDTVSEIIADTVQTSVGITFDSIFGEPPTQFTIDEQIEPCARVASVISFFGSPPWAMTLVLPEPTAIAMARKFTGFDVPFDCADMGDVVGELTNVLAGEVVAQLTRRSIQSQMSLPTVARGHDVELLKSAGSPAVQIGYQSTLGRFWFEICTASGVHRSCKKPGAAA
jgi:chemotaxis protein CheX